MLVNTFERDIMPLVDAAAGDDRRCRNAAAAASWTFRGDESRRRRRHELDIPWRRVAAPRPRAGHPVETGGETRALLFRPCDFVPRRPARTPRGQAPADDRAPMTARRLQLCKDFAKCSHFHQSWAAKVVVAPLAPVLGSHSGLAPTAAGRAPRGSPEETWRKKMLSSASLGARARRSRYVRV